MKHHVAQSILLIIAAAATAAAELPPGISGSRPGASDQAAEVEITTLLLDVSAIDGARQSLNADLFVLLRWRDPRLDGVLDSVRRVSLNEVWAPRLQIINGRDLDTAFPEEAEVTPDGTVTYRQRYSGVFAVPLDLHEFPLDHQHFEIQLVVVGSSPDEVRLVATPELAALGSVDRRFSVADWSLGEVSSAPAPYRVAPGVEPLSGWLVSFDGHRHLGYWTGVALVSVSIIGAMSWVVFWLDPKYVAPRMSVAVTSMLTLIAYRFLLGANLPKLAYLTRMDYFLMGSTLLVLLTIIQVAATTHMVDRDQGTRAHRVNRASRWLFPTAFVALLALVTWLI